MKVWMTHSRPRYSSGVATIFSITRFLPLIRKGGRRGTVAGLSHAVITPSSTMRCCTNGRHGEPLQAKIPLPCAKGVRGDPQWILHTTRPHDGGAVGIADINAYKKPNRLCWAHAYYMSLLAARYQDPLAQYFAQTIPADSHAFRDFPYILWYTPDLEAADPATQPTARLFRGLGWAAMRSSWEDDATFALFVCGDYYAGHQHMDQNSIVIHKQGNLAIDANQYGAKDTAFHNTILIGGSQRPFGNDPVRRVAPSRKGDSSTPAIFSLTNTAPVSIRMWRASAPTHTRRESHMVQPAGCLSAP